MSEDAERTFTVEEHTIEADDFDLEDNGLDSIEMTAHRPVTARSQTLKLSDDRNVIRIEGPPQELHEGESWKVTIEDLQDMFDDMQRLTRIRGETLSDGSEIEELLGNIAQLFLFGKRRQTSSKLFREHVLETRSFTLHDKWQLFRAITKQSDQLDASNLRRKVKDAIEVRNKFAHGTIVFVDKDAHLKYSSGSGRTYDHLTSEYLDAQEETMKNAVESLIQLDHGLASGEYETFNHLPQSDGE